MASSSTPSLQKLKIAESGLGRLKELTDMENENLTSSVSGTNANNVNVIVQDSGRKSNGLGTAGFVLSLIGLLICWIPVVDWIIWFLGALFSLIGVFRRPRGLAIAGLVISFIGIIAIVVVVAAIAAAFSLS